MTSTDGTQDQLEVIFDPGEGTVFLYRSIPAGICGPMTTAVLACDRTAAEVEALRHGLLRSGPWVTAANGHDYAPVVRTTI